MCNLCAIIAYCVNKQELRTEEVVECGILHLIEKGCDTIVDAAN